MNEIPWTQIVTAVIAIYGAIFSTITFFQNRKDKKKNLKIKFSNGFLTYDVGLSELMLFITVYNIGGKSLLINSPRIVLSDGKSFVFPNPQSDVKFPHKLEEGAKCEVWTEMKALAKELYKNGYKGKIRLMADVSDGTDKKYKTKKAWIFNVDMWLN